MTGKRDQGYVRCAVCGHLVRSDRFEKHAMMHWLTSSTEKSFREFYSELRKGAEAAPVAGEEGEPGRSPTPAAPTRSGA